VAIFNYQKASSPVVASTLYALRTSPLARRHLGDEVYFAHRIPWIAGEMNQLHGRIDISFRVRGSRGQARMRFASARVGGARGVFETREWALVLDDGSTVDLLVDGAADPFRELPGIQGDGVFAAGDDDAAAKGFRQGSVKKQG
jgi:cytochrome c oxidase assembly factor 1